MSLILFKLMSRDFMFFSFKETLSNNYGLNVVNGTLVNENIPLKNSTESDMHSPLGHSTAASR